MDEKDLRKEILDAIDLSIEIESGELSDSCGTYGPENFSGYWKRTLEEAEVPVLESHCLDCPRCLQGLASARDQLVEEISSTIDVENLIHAGLERLREPTASGEEVALWAATPSQQLFLKGEALGMIVSEEGDWASSFKCTANVRDDVQLIGRLELWATGQDKRRPDGVERPLDDFEKHLISVFRKHPLLQALHFDRRDIRVEFEERTLKDPTSLSLAIIMAILNAIYAQKEPVPTAYSAGVEPLGGLKKVGGVERKLQGAKQEGIKQFVLAADNKDDCPSEYLADPEFKVLFFNRLEELFEDNNVVPKMLQIPMREERDFDFILQRAEEQGMDSTVLARMIPLLEKLCERGHDFFSTVFVMGPSEKINSVLPQSGIEIATSSQLFENLRETQNRAALVNGESLGFVLNPFGELDSIRKVNVEIQPSSAISPLLSGANHKYAWMSLATNSLIFFFPPTEQDIHAFISGELICKYLYGYWRRTDYSSITELLHRTSKELGLDWISVKKVARAAIAMSERRIGGIFIFSERIDDLAGKWVDRIKMDFGLRVQPMPVEYMSEEELISLAKEKGALLIDGEGLLHAAGAYFKVPIQVLEEHESEISKRHRIACQVSREVGCFAIVASRYGTVTVYDRGKEQICV